MGQPQYVQQTQQAPAYQPHQQTYTTGGMQGGMQSMPGSPVPASPVAASPVQHYQGFADRVAASPQPGGWAPQPSYRQQPSYGPSVSYGPPPPMQRMGGPMMGQPSGPPPPPPPPPASHQPQAFMPSHQPSYGAQSGETMALRAQLQDMERRIRSLEDVIFDLNMQGGLESSSRRGGAGGLRELEASRQRNQYDHSRAMQEDSRTLRDMADIEDRERSRDLASRTGRGRSRRAHRD